MRSDEAIVLSNIVVRYHQQPKPVLDIEQLTIYKGERIALIGSSGAGKTTLLRLINGYIRPKKGQIHVLGDIPYSRIARRRSIRRRVGYVFQDFNLIDRATAFENVLWGRLGHVNPFLSLLGHFSNTDKQVAVNAINDVGLSDFGLQRTDTLSGGQKQRIAIARVLAQKSEIILADEPVSNLDPRLADDIIGLLVQMSVRYSATLIMGIHQPNLARRYVDRVIGLRNGSIVFDDSADQLDNTILKTIYGDELNQDFRFVND